jgi:biopolymer transport protein ExbD
MKTRSVAIATWVCCAAVGCQQPSRHDSTSKTAKFVLSIDRDRSLTLDGKPLTPEELAKEWPRLAAQIRDKAKAGRKTLADEQVLPALIVIWAADSTPYSVVHSVMFQAQQSGFDTCALHPKSRLPDPFHTQLGDDVAIAVQSSELPDVLRTIPIRLLADEQGAIRRLGVGDEIELENFEALGSEINKFQDDPETPFDRALLTVDSNLKFSELARVTDLLANHRIKTIGSVEMRPD